MAGRGIPISDWEELGVAIGAVNIDLKPIYYKWWRIGSHLFWALVRADCVLSGIFMCKLCMSVLVGCTHMMGLSSTIPAESKDAAAVFPWWNRSDPPALLLHFSLSLLLISSRMVTSTLLTKVSSSFLFQALKQSQILVMATVSLAYLLHPPAWTPYQCSISLRTWDWRWRCWPFLRREKPSWARSLAQRLPT